MDINLSKEDLTRAIDILDRDTEKILNKISSFRKEGISKKQSTELWHVGKFLSLLGDSAEIILQDDRPDFIISYEGRRIGLEHQRIIKPTIADSKAIENIISESATTFKAKYPDVNFLAAIYWGNPNFRFTKNDSDKIKTEIAEYVYEVYSRIGIYDGNSNIAIYEETNASVTKPDYIDEVHLTPYSDLEFYYNPGGYVISNINQQTLQSEISKKETLVNSYKENSKVNEQWLLLVLSTTSPHSFHFPRDENFVTNTSFDKVFVLEDFDNKIYEIKK